MEEDIEYFNKWIEYDKEHRIVTIYDEKPLFRERLENLIKGYRNLKAKVKRYEKYLENKDKKFEEALEYEYQERETDYIPKSKIKEKIEELKKENEQTYTKFLASDRANANLGTKGKMIEGAIQVLQELLEEEE